MSAEENKAIVRRYFEELWNKGDLSFIEEYIGPDVTHSWGHETRESWRVALSAWLTAFADFHYHVDELVAEGDCHSSGYAGSPSLLMMQISRCIQHPPTQQTVSNPCYSKTGVPALRSRRVS